MDDIREAKHLTIKRRGDIGRAALKPTAFLGVAVSPRR